MKKTIAFAIIALTSSMAMATNQGSPGTGNGGGGGGGGGGGAGIAVAAAQANNQVGITTKVGLSSTVLGGATTALGGSIGSGAGSSSLTNNYRAAASTAYAPAASAPRTSCRLTAGIGGGGVSGSGSGGFPIGNDQTCLTGTRIELMNQVNAQYAETFTRNDYLDAVCLVEGMDATKPCIDYKASKPAVKQQGLGNGYISN